jgi:Tol biopolymer transport system component
VASPRAPVAWAPGTMILCSVHGGDYLLLDTRTGRTTTMGTSDSLGWITYPQFTPGGTRVAWWSMLPKGMWMMDLTNGVRTRVMPDGPVLPLGWTSDGHTLYALDWRGQRSGLLRVPMDPLKKEERLEITTENVAEVAVSPDGRWAVYTVGSQQHDVWLAEGFDPDAP